MKRLNDKKIKSINNKARFVSLKDKFSKYRGKNLAKEFRWNAGIGKEIL